MTEGPNTELMQAYGTEDAYMQKNAGAISWFLQQLASNSPRLLGGYYAQQRQGREAQAVQLGLEQARLQNRYFEEAEQARLFAASEAIRRTRVPIMVAPYMPHGDLKGPPMKSDDVGYPADIPPGLDSGMVRLASAIGQQLAKEAAPKAPAGVVKAPKLKAPKKMGWEGQMFAGGLGLAGVAGLGHALRKSNIAMSSESGVPSYNQGGYQAPPSVNQYGYTSF